MEFEKSAVHVLINAHLQYPLVLQGPFWCDSLRRVPVQAPAQEAQKVLVVGLDGGGQLLGARASPPTLGVGEVLGVILGVWGEEEGGGELEILQWILQHFGQPSMNTFLPSGPAGALRLRC